MYSFDMRTFVYIVYCLLIGQLSTVTFCTDDIRAKPNLGVNCV